MKKLFLLASLLMAFGISADAGDITSPNGQIKVNFTLDGTVPTYSVTYQGKTIIKPSRLGYQLAKGGKDGKDLLSDFSVINEKTSTFDETWNPVWGENKSIRNHYNDMLVELKQNSTDSYMNVRFRFSDTESFTYSTTLLGIEKEDSAFSYPHTGRSAVIFSNSCARNVSLSLRWLLCGASPFSRYPSHLYTVPNQKNRIKFSSKNRE